MKPVIEQHYAEVLSKYGFHEGNIATLPTKLGTVYKIPDEAGGGYYWVYALDDQYAIKFHNFYFNEDFIIEFDGQENLNICYYYSISGEELSPYRKIHAGQIRLTNGDDFHFKALIHKNIPIQTVEIEIYPRYYEQFIKNTMGDKDLDLKTVFRSIDWCTDFPEMENLLHQIWTYRGEGTSAKLFYNSKVSEAISLIIDYNTRKKEDSNNPLISAEDRKAIEFVNHYLNDHFSDTVSIDKLCKIACFGRTKFKTLFKQVNRCTVTEYVTDKRLNQAEFLLRTSNLTIEQIACAIGYSNAGRFSALFKNTTGIFPSDYRKIATQISQE